MKQERDTVDKIIKTRAPKSHDGWRSVSIPAPIYDKLETMSKEIGESVSLIVRKCLTASLKTK